MDARREDDSLRRFFIAKGLAGSGGFRAPARQAGIFSARTLIDNTMASFVSIGGFDDHGVDCSRARVDFTSDGGILFDSFLDTPLTVQVAYVVGFAFKRSGFGDGALRAFGFPNVDGHRAKFKVGSSWLRDHWKDAMPEGIVFQIIADTNLQDSAESFVETWTRLFPVPFHYIGGAKAESW